MYDKYVCSSEMRTRRNYAQRMNDPCLFFGIVTDTKPLFFGSLVSDDDWIGKYYRRLPISTKYLHRRKR